MKSQRENDNRHQSNSECKSKKVERVQKRKLGVLKQKRGVFRPSKVKNKERETQDCFQNDYLALGDIPGAFVESTNGLLIGTEIPDTMEPLDSDLLYLFEEEEELKGRQKNDHHPATPHS